MSRRLLQISNVVLALMIIALAGISLVHGIDNPIYGGILKDIPVLDSNLRFMGGIGRVISMLVVFTLIEVPGVPLLIYLLHKVAQATGLNNRLMIVDLTDLLKTQNS